MSARRQLRASLREWHILCFRLLCSLLASQLEASRANIRQTVPRVLVPCFHFDKFVDAKRHQTHMLVKKVLI